MTVAAPTPIYCPGCRMGMIVDVPGPNRCPSCGWSGDVFTFQPNELEKTAAELALPDEATCINHPRKKATAVCAGTGDYICSLCAVPLNGKTYSAQYLEAGGKEKAARAFDRSLERPDSKVRLLLLMHFIPYVNVIAIADFLVVPYMFVLLSRARKLRRSDPVYTRVISPASLVVMTIILMLWSIGYIVGVVALVVMFSQRTSRY